MQALNGVLNGESPYDTLMSLMEKGLVCADSFVPIRQWLERKKTAGRTARQRVEQIVNQMLLTNPAPDKVTDPMAWVQHMTALNQTAEEMVLNDLIYT